MFCENGLESFIADLIRRKPHGKIPCCRPFVKRGVVESLVVFARSLIRRIAVNHVAVLVFVIAVRLICEGNKLLEPFELLELFELFELLELLEVLEVKSLFVRSCIAAKLKPTMVYVV